MITIFLNNQVIYIEGNKSLLLFLKEKNMLNDYSAVAINLQFIPKEKYGETKLHNDDRIDIITPMQGG